jgi:hypothetical protein
MAISDLTNPRDAVHARQLFNINPYIALQSRVFAAKRLPCTRSRSIKIQPHCGFDAAQIDFNVILGYGSGCFDPGGLVRAAFSADFGRSCAKAEAPRR